MAHGRFAMPGVQAPCLLERFRLVNGHSLDLTKVLRPRGYQVFQTEYAGLIEALIGPALERAIAPARGLNFLHQAAKLPSILAPDDVFDRDGDWAVVVFRDYGQIVRVIERRCFDAGFRGKIPSRSSARTTSRGFKTGRRGIGFKR